MIPPLVVFRVTHEKPAEELPPPLPWKTGDQARPWPTGPSGW